MYKRYKFFKRLAYYDNLTNLRNRNWLEYNSNQLYNYKYVYFIDINNLRDINNSFGHKEGDAYIVYIIKNINHSGILIRYAGDEFILFSNVKNEITSNEYYSVGMSIIENSIKDAIDVADKNMILNKRTLKSEYIK